MPLQLLKLASAQGIFLRTWKLQKAPLTSPCSRPAGRAWVLANSTSRPTGFHFPSARWRTEPRSESFRSVIPSLFSQDQGKNNVRTTAGVFSWEHSGDGSWHYSHILHHDVLVGHKPVNPVVPSFPPVLLLEGQFSGRPPNVVKLGYRFYWLTFYKEHTRKQCGQGCQEGMIHSLKGLYEALERNKVILITRQNKVTNQDDEKTMLLKGIKKSILFLSSVSQAKKKWKFDLNFYGLVLQRSWQSNKNV